MRIQRSDFSLPALYQWSISVKLHWHLLFLVLVLLRVFLVLYHEGWRDEAEPLLVAHGASSFGNLLWMATYERSHALWPVILYGLDSIGLGAFFDMQVTYLIFSIATVAILIYGLPRIPFAVKGLLGASYLLMFEYTALPRPYGLTVLLLAIFVMLEMRWSRKILWKALTLFLMAFSNIAGLVLAIALAVYTFWNIPEQKIRNRVLLAGIMVVGVGLSIWSAMPPPDIYEDVSLQVYRSTAFAHFGIPRALTVSTHFLVDGFFYIPKVTHAMWWNSDSLLRDWVPLATQNTSLFGALGGFLALWGLWRLFRMNIGLGLAAVILWGGMLAVYSVGHPGQIRHMGILVLGTMGLLALASIQKRKLPLTWARKVVLYTLLTIYAVSGLWAVYADGNQVFSQAINVSKWLEANYPDELVIIYPDYTGQAIAAYIGEGEGRYYSLEGEKEMTYMRMDRSRLHQVSSPLVDKVDLGRDGRILVVNYPFVVTDAKVNFTVELLKSFTPAMVPDESFWVYRVRYKSEDEKVEITQNTKLEKMETIILLNRMNMWHVKQEESGIVRLQTSGWESGGIDCPQQSLKNEAGTTVELKMKILKAPGKGWLGAMFSLLDGKREGKLSFFSDRIEIRDQDDLRAVYRMDTQDDFHTYRIAMVGDTMVVYVDGNRVVTTHLTRVVERKAILLGDFSKDRGENVDMKIEYLTYWSQGAVGSKGEIVTPIPALVSLSPVTSPFARRPPVSNPVVISGSEQRQVIWMKYIEAYPLRTKGTEMRMMVREDDRLNNGIGSTAELKMKVIDAPIAGYNGVIFSVQDGSREGKLSFFSDRIEIRDQDDLRAVYRMDTQDDFHTYRVAMVGDTMVVYVDGNEVASTSLSQSVGGRRISVGDFSNKMGQNIWAQIDYLTYTDGGAINPQGKELFAVPPVFLGKPWGKLIKQITIKTTGTELAINQIPEERLDNRIGSTAEMRMRILEAPATGTHGAMFSLQDGKREGKVSFFNDHIKIFDADLLRAEYRMDTTDSFHTYRIAIVRDVMKVYIDGKEVASIVFVKEVSQRSILFGDFSKELGENVNAQIEYVAYSAQGAVHPQGEAVIPQTRGKWLTIWQVVTIKTTGTELAINQIPEERLDNRIGSTAEVRMRILEAPATGTHGAIFSLQDGKREGKISFYHDHIEIKDCDNLKAEYQMDTGDDFHTYWIAIVGDLMKVYVDDKKVATVALSVEVSGKNILFGDFSSEEGENMNVNVEYLTYSVDGAEDPQGKAVTLMPKVPGKWNKIIPEFSFKTTGTELGINQIPDDRLDNKIGATAEVRMRILEAPATGTHGAIFSLQGGKREGKLSFFSDHIEIRDQNNWKATYEMDTTDGFHTYRIAIIENTLKVYVDGEEIALVMLSNYITDKNILFGDFSSEEGENMNVNVEYLTYSVDGAMAPEVSTK